MVAYSQFVKWSRSADSETRGQAAHLVAAAYVEHDGPPDERAALYAALFGFLDDPSVKVRASLAYGLLRSERAPRIIMLALAKDAPVIARAILQFSPVLLDADLINLLGEARSEALSVLPERKSLSEEVVRAIVETGRRSLTVQLLKRTDLPMPADLLQWLAEKDGGDARMRGLLLARVELPAYARLLLVEQSVAALSNTRIVKGAVAPQRLNRLLRDAQDSAAARIGERQAAAGQSGYASALKNDERINTRLLMHAAVTGNMLFFAECLSQLSQIPARKIFALLGNGPRTGLNVLFAKCGMAPSLRNLMARIILHARTADLSDDVAARFFVVTSLIEELIIEHQGTIPADLQMAFAYLNEQNLALARQAARGVMPGFAEKTHVRRQLPDSRQEPTLALPAA